MYNFKKSESKKIDVGDQEALIQQNKQDTVQWQNEHDAGEDLVNVRDWVGRK